MVFIITIGFDN